MKRETPEFSPSYQTDQRYALRKELVRLKHGQRPEPSEFGMISNAGGFQEPLDIQNKKSRDIASLFLLSLSIPVSFFGWNFMFE